MTADTPEERLVGMLVAGMSELRGAEGGSGQHFVLTISYRFNLSAEEFSTLLPVMLSPPQPIAHEGEQFAGAIARFLLDWIDTHQPSRHGDAFVCTASLYGTNLTAPHTYVFEVPIAALALGS